MNIYDIAEKANVSIATISRVVNGSDKVSDKTRMRVLAIMEEMGYTPNVFARGLCLDSMNTVGILCPDISDAFMSNCVSIIERSLREYQYDALLSCSGYSRESKKKCVELILSKRVDALFLVSSAYTGSGNDPGETDYILEAAKQVPVFMVNGYVPGDNIYCFYGADYQAAYDAAQRLIRAGKRGILFLCSSHSYSATQKRKGYEAALRDAGLPVRDELEVYVQNKIHVVKELLLERKDLDFNAVLATDDGLAVGALKYAHAQRISVPDELSIIGYNNSSLALCCEPELTSIDNCPEKLCFDAVDSMMKVLDGASDICQKNEIACKVIARGTTIPTKTANAGI